MSCTMLVWPLPTVMPSAPLSLCACQRYIFHSNVRCSHKHVAYAMRYLLSTNGLPSRVDTSRSHALFPLFGGFYPHQHLGLAQGPAMPSVSPRLLNKGVTNLPHLNLMMPLSDAPFRSASLTPHPFRLFFGAFAISENSSQSSFTLA